MTAGLQTAEKIHAVSWHETHRDAVELAHRLKQGAPWKGLVAISRGGLVPAAIVARILGIRLIDTVCLWSYDGRDKGPVEVIKSVAKIVKDGKGWLVVDDLVDSGATAVEARRLLPAGHLACLYAKPAGRPFADTFIREVPQDVWIEFPWDRGPAVE